MPRFDDTSMDWTDWNLVHTLPLILLKHWVFSVFWWRHFGIPRKLLTQWIGIHRVVLLMQRDPPGPRMPHQGQSKKSLDLLFIHGKLLIKGREGRKGERLLTHRKKWHKKDIFFRQTKNIVDTKCAMLPSFIGSRHRFERQSMLMHESGYDSFEISLGHFENIHVPLSCRCVRSESVATEDMRSIKHNGVLVFAKNW